MLETLAPHEPYRSGEFAFEEGQSLNFSHYFDVFRRRIFYFLLPFGLVSILGVYVIAAVVKPTYLSEGKILVETQRIAPDLVRPIVTATPNERIQLVQQRILTRDNLLSVAHKFGLFPNQTGVLDLMRQGTLIKPVEVEGPRLGTAAIAFTVGFEYENPEMAMKVANEFVSLIVDDDARSRTGRATEAVKILTSEAKDIEDRLEATQSQIFEIERRPHDSLPEAPDKERSQLTALAALKAELIQKTSVYSEAHPAVTALRKRIAAMEKSLTQSPPAAAKAQPAPADDIDAVKRQREALERRLGEANVKLAAARLAEKLDRDQQSERLQVIEPPSLPQKPLKSSRLKMVGMVLAAAVALGTGAAIAAEMLDGSIRGRHQLLGMMDSYLIVSIPYFTTRSDLVKARWRRFFVFFSLSIILVALFGLAAAILFNLPVDFSWLAGARARLTGAK